MIHDDVNSVEAYDELACYRCGSVSDIEDTHCNNCGTLLREDSILM